MGTIAYSVDDKISIQIDDLVVDVSPLTYQEKIDLQKHLLLAGDGNMQAAVEASVKALKFGIKGIKNLKNSEGKDFKLKFEENKRYLTDDCVSDLLNIKQNNRLVQICTALLQGISDNLLQDPYTGENLEGVEFVKEESEKK